MKTHDIEGLRARLFDAMDGIKAGTITIEQARQISDLSQVIVNTARVEVDYLRVTDGRSSPFLDNAGDQAALQNGIAGIVRHRIKG